MNRSQRIALAMRGYRPALTLTVAQPYGIAEGSDPFRVDTYVIVRDCHVVGEVAARLEITPPPTTYVMLARESGLPCS